MTMTDVLDGARQRAGTAVSTDAFLRDDAAMACLVLWKSGFFDTLSIANVLHVREDAVCRTLHMARDGARADRVAG